MSRSLAIRIEGIEVFAHHGVLPEERAEGQTFLFDVELVPASDRACDTDDLADAVDYGAVAARGRPARGVPRPPRRRLRPQAAGADRRAVRRRRGDGRARGMTAAVVGLGGNIGDVAESFRSALAALDAADGVRVARVSSLYRTAPVGGVEQEDFLNAAALLEVDLEPAGLLSLLHAIEDAHARSRDVHWGPRTLDLDLLWVDGAALAAPGLIVPHPRLHERRFALAPLVEVAPEAADPGGRPYADVLAGLPEDGVAVVATPAVVYDPPC